MNGNRCENESCNGCEIFFKFAEADNLDELMIDSSGRFVKNSGD